MKKKTMAPQDDMSHLKKLLKPIRTLRRSALGDSIIPASKKIVLGVHISEHELRIVKAARISNDRWKLLGCFSVPFEPDMSISDPRFHQFLGSSVSAIAPDGKYDLWTLISPVNVDVRHVRIPKIPKAQVPNAVHWTVKRETNFNEKESIIDFEVQGEVLEKGIAKIGIMAYIIPGKDLEEMRDLFSRSGLSVRGITVTPFAIQNLFRSGCVPNHNKPVGVLYIGNEHSRIDVFSGGNLVLTRGMKAGVDSMVEALDEAYEEEWKVAGNAGEELLTTYKNEAVSRREDTKALLLSVFSGSFSPDESIGQTDPGEEAVFEMIRPALDRLAKQVERTFEYYSVTLGNERVDTVYVSCAAGYWERPFDFIADRLGVERNVLDPLEQGAILTDEVPAPANIAQRVPFTGAVGLALSDNVRTPNLIFTYRDKEKVGKIARINRGIFCAFVAVILVLAGVFSWQARLAGQEEAEIVRLQAELEGYNPRADRNTVASLAAKVIAQRRAMVERSSRLIGTAVIGELVSLTPPNVRLLSLRAVLEGKPDEREKNSASGGATKGPGEAKSEAKKGLVLEGIVTGRRDAQEASLAGYVIKLSASRLFLHPVVSSNAFESYADEGEVLRFSLQIGLP